MMLKQEIVIKQRVKNNPNGYREQPPKELLEELEAWKKTQGI